MYLSFINYFITLLNKFDICLRRNLQRYEKEQRIAFSAHKIMLAMDLDKGQGMTQGSIECLRHLEALKCNERGILPSSSSISNAKRELQTGKQLLSTQLNDNCIIFPF